MTTNNLNRIHNLDSFNKKNTTEVLDAKKNTSEYVNDILNGKEIFEKYENDNLDLSREIMLAKIFGIKNFEKIKEDYIEKPTLNQILNLAESYWKYQKASNDNIYKVAV